jgi:hypothetical protein
LKKFCNNTSLAQMINILNTSSVTLKFVMGQCVVLILCDTNCYSVGAAVRRVLSKLAHLAHFLAVNN